MAATNFQFTTLENIYYYYSFRLFDEKLPECLITLARHRGAHGVFAPERWVNAQQQPLNEIILNPATMNRPVHEWHSTLVHEACHHWQMIFGKYSGAYHNQEWADKMESVGLMPSHTGAPGGKKTGYRMTHYIIKGGPFDIAFKDIKAEDLNKLVLPFQPNVLYADDCGPVLGPDGTKVQPGAGPASPGKVRRNGVKKAYICACSKVWGKSGLSMKCESCSTVFTEQ